MRKTILLTGASGFIGQNLAFYWLKKDYQLISILPLDEKRPVSFLNSSDSIEILNDYKEFISPFENKIIFIRGDITNIAFLISLFQYLQNQNIQLDYIVNLAGCSTIQKAKENKNYAWNVNLNGVQNLAQVCHKFLKKLGIKGFIHASTDKVYGEGSRQSYHENDELKPLPFPYDESKAAADKWLRQFVKENNFPAVLLRFCNVYGPADFHKNRLVPGTIYKILYENTSPLLKMWKNDQQNPKSFCRDLIYIDDLIHAIDLLTEQKDFLKIMGNAYNLGTGHCYEISQVMQIILSELNYKLQPKIEIIQSGEIAEQAMDFEKAQKAFGFTPQTNLQMGLKKTIDWYLKNGEKIYEFFE